MQEPTHILAGVIIQKCFDWRRRRAVAFSLIAVLAFLSHGLLDKIANVTYHPPQADFHDPFWVGYHLTVLLATILFLYIWWRQFKWGIIFAMLPDVDWVFIHGQKIFHINIPWYQRPHLHNLLHWIYEKIPPLSFLDHLPNHRHNTRACLWELLLVGVMLLAIRLLTKRKPDPVASDSVRGPGPVPLGERND